MSCLFENMQKIAKPRTKTACLRVKIPFLQAI